MSPTKLHTVLPPLVRQLCWIHEAWIVGGAARVLCGDEMGIPRDFDVLVPFHTWGRACLLIPRGTPANSFGGFKVRQRGIEIDVWAGDVGWHLAHAPRGKQRIAFSPENKQILRASELML